MNVWPRFFVFFCFFAVITSFPFVRRRFSGVSGETASSKCSQILGLFNIRAPPNKTSTYYMVKRLKYLSMQHLAPRLPSSLNVFFLPFYYKDSRFLTRRNRREPAVASTIRTPLPVKWRRRVKSCHGGVVGVSHLQRFHFHTQVI